MSEGLTCGSRSKHEETEEHKLLVVVAIVSGSHDDNPGYNVGETRISSDFRPAACRRRSLRGFSMCNTFFFFSPGSFRQNHEHDLSILVKIQ